MSNTRIMPPRGTQLEQEFICRGCACTDSHACHGGCAWVMLDVGPNAQKRLVPLGTGICSQCAIDMGWRPEAMLTAMCDDVIDLLEASAR
jgi:hypothetical protein